MRLINADALPRTEVTIKKRSVMDGRRFIYPKKQVVYGYNIDKAPTVDAEPVVHARWIANNICSVCREGIKGWAIQSGYKFCPFCGAKMDGGADNA